MANTGLRPDEALRLEVRDVKIETEPGSRDAILVIDVRGKVGTGYCKSMPGAVYPFTQLRQRRAAEIAEAVRKESDGELSEKGVAKLVEQRLPTTPLFRGYDRATFNAILDEQGLKLDRDGQRRTAYSLRHTYISMRLMDGANIHQVANNCRTSVQMIEEHYAAHIKNRLDASAINVRKPTRKSRRKEATKAESHSATG
jgi:integrase